MARVICKVNPLAGVRLAVGPTYTIPAEEPSQQNNGGASRPSQQILLMKVSRPSQVFGINCSGQLRLLERVGGSYRAWTRTMND